MTNFRGMYRPLISNLSVCSAVLPSPGRCADLLGQAYGVHKREVFPFILRQGQPCPALPLYPCIRFGSVVSTEVVEGVKVLHYRNAPSLLETQTNFFLAPGTIADDGFLFVSADFQKALQMVLLGCALVAVPLMLIPIPVIEYFHRKHTAYGALPEVWTAAAHVLLWLRSCLPYGCGCRFPRLLRAELRDVTEGARAHRPKLGPRIHVLGAPPCSRGARHSGAGTDC